MYENLFPELLRGSSAFIPGAVFQYANELNLEMEDVGFLSLLFYCLSSIHTPMQPGISIREVQKIFPNRSNSSLSRRLNRLEKAGLIGVEEASSHNFNSKTIYLEPLFDKINALLLRDHPELQRNRRKSPELLEKEKELTSCQEEIARLQQELEQARQINGNVPLMSNPYFSTIAKFITEHTGNMLSSLMMNEINQWLDGYGIDHQLLLCLLDLCFERKITTPQEITRLVREIKEYDITSVDGLNQYFEVFVDKKQILSPAYTAYQAELIELERFLNIDMKAEARRNLYYKWRNDWGFSHAMIMKAGEMMSTRTKQGGLEYMNQILSRWREQKIFTLEDVEKEMAERRKKTGKANRSEKTPVPASHYTDTSNTLFNTNEIYIPKSVLEELKKNA